MNAPGPRIALVHAVTVAMAPIERAFRRDWPQAQLAHLLDDTLAADLERAGTLDAALTARIRRLAEHAVGIGAAGVLFTCSSFGEAIEAASAALSPVPVLKPNEAMFRRALATGRRIGMIATFAPAIAPMEREFQALIAQAGADATIESICVPDAMTAARAGDHAAHDSLVAAAAPRLAHCDVVMLAQFSVAPALDAVRQAVDCPVFSAPEEAVAVLRSIAGLGNCGDKDHDTSGFRR
jgi:hypothetical protein